MQILDAPGRVALADRLDESAETMISLHLLRSDLCRVFAEGDQFVIQNLQDPAEPTAFGTDAGVIWRLLKHAEGWKCVTVPTPCAGPLGNIVSQDIDRAVRYYRDVYHTMTTPATHFQHSQDPGCWVQGDI